MVFSLWVIMHLPIVSVYIRYSVEETSDWGDETLTSDISKFTISPSYIFTDNLSGLVEFSTYDEDIAGW